MRLRTLSWFVVLAFALALALVPALAQDETSRYKDPNGKFSVPIPAGWIDNSTQDYGLFQKDGLSVYLLTMAADTPEAGIQAALAALGSAFAGVPPTQSDEAPLPNGTWLQQVFIEETGTTGVALAQVQNEMAYIIYLETPSIPALQAANDDLTAILVGFTIGEAVDLSAIVPAPLTNEQLADIEQYITASLDNTQIPGAAVVIVQQGQVVYLKGFGVRDLESQEPVTPETRFMIGSTTKSMTTMMMGTLVDAGLLDWNTPVTDILPEFALSDPEATPLIRVRDLVNNSSGLPRYDAPLLLQSMTPEEIIELIKTIPLVAQPHEQYGYSNHLVAVGGFVAALAAGAEYGENIMATYTDLIQKRVFDPIGMERSTLDMDAALADANHAIPYTQDWLTGATKPLNLEIERHVIAIAPASGAWSDAEDMAQYLLTQLNRGLAPDGTRVVSEASLETTQSPEVTIAGTLKYGMGWMIDSYHGQRFIKHDGNTQGFTCVFGFLPDAQLGVVVLVNRGLANNFGSAVSEYVFETAFGLEHTADAYYQTAEASLHEMIAGVFPGGAKTTVDAQAVADWLGEYEYHLTITLDDQNRLHAASDFGDMVLVPVPNVPNTFAFMEALGAFEFQKTDGKVSVTISSLLDGMPVTVQKIE